MTAKEVRDYRNVNKKLVEVEERSKLLQVLRKKGVNLSEEEYHVQRTFAKFRVLGDKKGLIAKKQEEIMSLSLNLKIKDNNLYGGRLRRKKNWLRGKLEDMMGKKSPDWRKLEDDIRTHCSKHRRQLKEKNRKKVEHLVRKFGGRTMVKTRWEDVDKEVRELMGSPSIFVDDVMTKIEEIKEPVFVLGPGEEIVLSENERAALKLGPKFCVYTKLSDEEFEVDVEECILKIKWDMMGEDGRGTPGEEDKALEVLLGAEVCNRIDAEKEEELCIKEGEMRVIYDGGTKTLDFGKRRATDIKGNSRVIFPRKARTLGEESALETLRMELFTTFKQYVQDKCDDKGNQKSNLTKGEEEGLKSIRKRVKNGDIVVIPTDKSGNLAVMSRGTYLEAGMAHTRRDLEVGWDSIKDSQRELNGHVSMMIKIFRIGSSWKHTTRVRESMMGEGQSVCPLSLLFKDHKGWSAAKKTPPPTRPVAGGHLGINLHISEIVSDILDPVVGCYRGGREIISTEDMVAKVEILNDGNNAWHRYAYWRGMVMEEYVACTVCLGEDDYVWSEESPELCVCDDGDDGIDDLGRVKVTPGCMMRMRRARWEKITGEWPLDKEVRSEGVPPDMLQDYSVPMVVLGSDVVNLYPSLDIKQVVWEVRDAMMETEIKWGNIDYLEAARYIALNWSELQCRRSDLSRVLPRRRKKTGSRPRLTGTGPTGAQRGDQEQWEFPQVRLSSHEKRLLVATVVELATEFMFTHNYYRFAGNKYQQKEGGPIGLRGTCTIARLVLQVFDRKWERVITNAGVKMELYMRYMDDGRKFLHPIKYGWRWIDGSMVYSRGWEYDDQVMSRSHLEVTMGVVKETVKGIADYLEFTFESGEDYPDKWLPTLDTSLRVNPSNIVEYKYYEKPTTTNTTVRMATAMSENSKLQCLSNDLVRRLLNTRVELPSRYREEVIERYGTKLLTSGYGLEQTRKILLNGVKGYITKKRRRQAGGRRRIHNTAEESSTTRVRKKLLGKTSWYRPKARSMEQMDGTGHGMGRSGKERKGATPPKVRAVLFVEQTPLGELAKRVRELITRLEPTLGYSLKVVERTGRSITSLFGQSKLWEGLHCGRDACITCGQGGDRLPACTRSSVVYENICTRCNPDTNEKGEHLLKKEGTAPSLYIGESSRTIQERALEHWGAARKGDKKSHMYKHQTMEHGGEPPAFI